MIKVSKQQKKEEIHKEEAVLKKVPVISLMVNTISLSASLNKVMEWGCLPYTLLCLFCERTYGGGSPP